MTRRPAKIKTKNVRKTRRPVKIRTKDAQAIRRPAIRPPETNLVPHAWVSIADDCSLNTRTVNLDAAKYFAV